MGEPDIDRARKTLKSLIDQRPELNLRTLSRQLGKNDAYLHQYLYRNSPRHLPEKLRYMLAEYLHVHEGILRNSDQEHSDIPEVIPIPFLDVEVSAGYGTIAEHSGFDDTGHNYSALSLGENHHSSGADGASKKRWMFDRQSLSQIFSGTYHALRMLNIRGDSMYPVLEDGDIILVNTDDIMPSPPGIFVLYDGLGVMAKRIELIPGGQNAIRISSANTHYSSYQRSLQDITILGRVIWFGRKLVHSGLS